MNEGTSMTYLKTILTNPSEKISKSMFNLNFEAYIKQDKNSKFERSLDPISFDIPHAGKVSGAIWYKFKSIGKEQYFVYDRLPNGQLRRKLVYVITPNVRLWFLQKQIVKSSGNIETVYDVNNSFLAPEMLTVSSVRVYIDGRIVRQYKLNLGTLVLLERYDEEGKLHGIVEEFNMAERTMVSYYRHGTLIHKLYFSD